MKGNFRHHAMVLSHIATTAAMCSFRIQKDFRHSLDSSVVLGAAHPPFAFERTSRTPSGYGSSELWRSQIEVEIRPQSSASSYLRNVTLRLQAHRGHRRAIDMGKAIVAKSELPPPGFPGPSHGTQTTQPPGKTGGHDAKIG